MESRLTMLVTMLFSWLLLLSILLIAEEKRKQEFFKARGLLKEQKEGQLMNCLDRVFMVYESLEGGNLQFYSNMPLQIFDG